MVVDGGENGLRMSSRLMSHHGKGRHHAPGCDVTTSMYYAHTWDSSHSWMLWRCTLE